VELAARRDRLQTISRGVRFEGAGPLPGDFALWTTSRRDRDAGGQFGCRPMRVRPQPYFLS